MKDNIPNGEYILINIDDINLINNPKTIRVYYNNDSKTIYYNLTESFVLFEYNDSSSFLKIELYDDITSDYNNIIYDVNIEIDNLLTSHEIFNNDIIKLNYKKISVN